MSKKLAIKGHPTRGKEVIELLEMMGGVNNNNNIYIGTSTSHVYFINGYGDIGKAFIENNVSTMRYWQIFTLEEFLEKYPYKVGDKVIDIADGDIGTIAVIKWDEDVSDMKYRVDFNNGDIGWFTNDTIYFYLNKDNKEMNQDIETNQCKVNGLKRSDEYLIMEGVECNECIKYYFPKGYEFVDTDDTGVYLKPIKPKYPTTYEDCCKVLGISYRAQLTYTNPEVECSNIYLTKEKHFLDAFMKLRICRNAYWKIAGEEMGLGKPWEPDWLDTNAQKYCIYYVGDEIKKQPMLEVHHFLAFPTAEMRDAFYENFKDLIEQCKELL